MSVVDNVNLYELLGIVPENRLTPEQAKEEMKKRREQWSKRKQDVKTGPSMRVKLDYLQQIQREVGEDLRQSQLDTWQSEARERKQKRVKARKEQLAAEIRFAALNGILLGKEISAWKKNYADVVNDDEIERMVNEMASTAQRDKLSIDTVIEMARIDLEALGFETLFDVIKVKPSDTDKKALQAATDVYHDADKHAKTSDIADVTRGLALKAKKIFETPDLASAYRTRVQQQQFYRDYVQPFETTCQATLVISAPQADYIVSLAERNKMKADEARATLFTVAAQHGWRVLAAAETTSERDANLQKQLKEYMEKVAEERTRATSAEDKARLLQQDIDRQKQRIDDLKHRAGTSDAAAKDAQRRLNEAQEQLAELTRGEQERLGRRIAARAPIFSAHVQRRELVAALVVAREFAQTPEAWRKDVERCERDIIAAERLLDEARRLLTSSAGQAEVKTLEALALCIDLEAAKKFLASIGIAPVSSLRAVIEGRAVWLTWNPSPSRDVTYVVVRSTERVPHTPQDGKQFGVFSQVEWFDNEPPAGRTLWYAVFAMRGSASSVAAPLTEPLYLKPDVENVRVETSDHLVKLTWDYPPGARNIILLRNDDHMPTSQLDGTAHWLGSKSDFTDPDVENGRNYFYKVYCAYEDAQGQQHYSGGVGIPATPEPLPSRVPSLSIAGADNSVGRRAIVITTESSERGRLVIYRTKQIISLVPGVHMMIEAVETLLGSDWKEIKDGKDLLWSSGTYYYVPILEFQGTAIVGEPHAYVYRGKGA